MLTPAARRWMYGMAAAAVPVAVYIGWIEPEASVVILPLLVALCNVQEDGPE